MAWRSGQSYSADLRERVLAAFDGGLPANAAAERFAVSISFIYKALKRRRVSGETTPGPGSRRSLLRGVGAQRNQQEFQLAAHHEAIRAEAERRPDVTLAELRGWLVEAHGVEASLGLMHNTLIRLGLTPKKSPGGRLAGLWGPRGPTGRAGSRRYRRAA